MRLAPLYLNFFLMISMPLLLGWFISHRRRVSWRLFAVGAATFILAQIAHIPFNYLVVNQWLAELSFSSQWTQLIVTALFLGLSAGLFEEGTRYMAYRFWAKDARTWGSGLMMGAGHGGVESILLGILGALNITILVGYGSGYFQDLIPSEQAPQVEQALDLLAVTPWFELMFGALERALALTIQMSLSLMVMQVLTRGKLRWLFLAFAWHALVDASVVVTADVGGLYAAEIVTGFAAIVSLGVVFRLREPEPSITRPSPLPELPPVQLKRIEPTKERLEESRYQ